MTKLLAQHGTAKGKKIDFALSSHYISGAIFSPREESFTSIQKYCSDSTLLTNDTCYLDPQLYYSTFDGKIFKHLEDDICYPEKITRRDWRKKTPELMNYIEKHATNSASISDILITPGFFIQTLDWHFDYSLDIYNHCCENYSFRKYYLSLLISNNFFHSKSDVDEMLEDILDNIDYKEGIYLTICYDKTDEKDYEYIDPQNLTNILYFIHSLNTAGFDIMVGYSFMNSVLFAMLNCEAVATGWFNNIRKFNRDRFEESETMGRRKKRYTSLPLFTYITFDNLNNASQSIALDDLLSGCIIDEYMSNSQDSISFVDLEQQYWQALSIIIEQINHYNSLSDRINHVLSELTNAKKLYASILNTLTDNKEAFNRIKSKRSIKKCLIS